MRSRKKITGLLLASAVMGACVFINGCSADESSDNSAVTTQNETETQETATAEPVTEESSTEVYSGPEILNFYQSAAGCRKLITEFTGPWTAGKDILSIDVFATGEAQISNNTFSVVWKEYWEKYEGAYGYKIGYCLEFDTASEGKVSRTILEPDDIYGFLDYIEVYIYDDVNVPPNTWYSHLLQEQVTDDTYITSIKLTCGKRIDEVSNVTLTAFAYKNENDFDSQGNYAGEHMVKCPVSRQN